jgi:hypothetical protein
VSGAVCVMRAHTAGDATVSKLLPLATGARNQSSPELIHAVRWTGDTEILSWQRLSEFDLICLDHTQYGWHGSCLRK